ncbi:hypothetical protein GGS21DRAFT_490570 [Xylaria nigripes]|nr:hypothetical protein GGS21DRAFT_490570 [Xylaria nigripes]
MAEEIAAGLRRATRQMHGIVVSAGLMDKTVKVRLEGHRWEERVHKWFKDPRYKLVHDPANSVRKGDVIAITPSWRESQHVRHVVKHIIAPYGVPIEDRPPIPSMEERAEQMLAKRRAKDERRIALRLTTEAGRAKFHDEAEAYLRTCRALQQKASRVIARIAENAKVEAQEAGSGVEEVMEERMV